MLSVLNRAKKRGFTLIELIVVIVILGLLAALAVPTFKSVIDNSKVGTETASLESLGRLVAADAAFSMGEYDSARLPGLVEDMGSDWSVASSSSKFGEVSAVVSDDAKSVELVSRSTIGDVCIVVTVTGVSASSQTGVASGDTCVAGDPVSVPEPVEPPVTTPPVDPEPDPDPEPEPEPEVPFVGPVSNLTLTSNTTTFQGLEWDSPGGNVTGFEITRDDVVLATRAATATTYTTPAPGSGQRHVYKVYTLFGEHRSEPVEIATLSPLNPVKDAVVTPGVTTGSASWTPPAGEVDGYVVSLTGSSSSIPGVFTKREVTDASISLEGLRPGTAYTLEIRGFNAAGTSLHSSKVKFTTAWQ